MNDHKLRMNLRGRDRNAVETVNNDQSLSTSVGSPISRRQQQQQGGTKTLPYYHVHINFNTKSYAEPTEKKNVVDEDYHGIGTETHDKEDTWIELSRREKADLTGLPGLPSPESQSPEEIGDLTGRPGFPSSGSEAPERVPDLTGLPGLPTPESRAPDLTGLPGLPTPESEAPDIHNPESEAPEILGSETSAPVVPNPEIPNLETEAPVVPEIPNPASDPEIPTPETTSEAPELPNTFSEAPNDPEELSSTKPPDNLSPGTPLAPPTLPPTNKNPSSCNTLSCKGLAALNNHPLLYLALFLIVSCLCFLRCKVCGGSRRGRTRDPRGEYRAVGRMLANNFDTELTEEDMNFYASDEDDDDPNYNGGAYNNNGWSNYTTNNNNKKGTIELGSIGVVDEANGGLTLEEMNG